MVRAGWGSNSCAVQRILRIQLTLEGLAVVGRAVGCLLGEDDGALDGLAVGLFVGSMGLFVGEDVGRCVGVLEGWGVVGLSVG